MVRKTQFYDLMTEHFCPDLLLPPWTKAARLQGKRFYRELNADVVFFKLFPETLSNITQDIEARR